MNHRQVAHFPCSLCLFSLKPCFKQLLNPVYGKNREVLLRSHCFVACSSCSGLLRLGLEYLPCGIGSTAAVFSWHLNTESFMESLPSFPL